MECSVCYDEEKTVKCERCTVRCCEGCVSQYLSTTGYPLRCMKCNNEYTDEFIYNNFSREFRVGYRTLEKEYIISKEENRLWLFQKLMDTKQGIEECYQRIDEYTKKIIDCLNKKLGDVLYRNFRQPYSAYSSMRFSPICYTDDELIEFGHISPDAVIEEYRMGLYPLESFSSDIKKKRNTELFKIYRECVGYIKEYKDCHRRLRELLLSKDEINSVIRGEKIKDFNEEEYIMACVKEGCNGRVSIKSHSCVVCDTRVCKKCLCIFLPKHKCKEGDVKSVSNVLKESKGCPNCYARISHVSGCSQMWCVLCNTAFDYSTGQPIKGIIHNPHYFEYVERTGHNIEEDNDMIGNYYTYQHKLGNQKSNIINGFRYEDWLRTFYRLAGELDMHNTINENSIDKNIRYLYLSRNKTVKNRKEFHTSVYNEFVRIKLNINIRDLFNTTYILLASTFNEHFNSKRRGWFERFYEACLDIIKMFNEQSYKRSIIIGSKLYYKLILDTKSQRYDFRRIRCYECKN